MSILYPDGVLARHSYNIRLHPYSSDSTNMLKLASMAYLKMLVEVHIGHILFPTTSQAAHGVSGVLSGQQLSPYTSD
jgi:hypothetical protein